MRRALFVIGALLCAACGGPAAQVAGTYNGQSSILITNNTGENQSASEQITVTQSGGELTFNVAACPIKAYSDSSNSFHVASFKCTKYLNTSTWTLDVSEGTVTANSNTFSMTTKGTATAGSQSGALTFTFSGTKSSL